MQGQVESMATQQNIYRRKLHKSRPQSTYSNKKTRKSIAGRIASILQRRRSKLNYLYQNTLIEIAESRLNLPHEGRKGLLYAVPEIPEGFTCQSLIKIFDNIIENMVTSGGPLNYHPPQGHIHSPLSTSSQPCQDFLTGDVDSPDDYDHYWALSPLSPSPSPVYFSANLSTEGELNELDWSPPTPEDSLLIDLRPESPPTPTEMPGNVRNWFGDELFLDILNGEVSVSQYSVTSFPTSETSNWPEPLTFNGSPFPYFDGNKTSRGEPQSESAPETVFNGMIRTVPPANLRSTIAKPKLQIIPPSPTNITPKSSKLPASKYLQNGQLILRKPVPDTPTTQKAELRKNFGVSQQSPRGHAPILSNTVSACSISLLDELNSELDRLLSDLNPSTEAFTVSNAKYKHETTPNPLMKPHFSAAEPTGAALFPNLLQPTQRPRSDTLPPSHRIPTRTSSRPQPSHQPSPPSPSPSPLPSPSFRDRLGKSTLTALLTASSTPEFEAVWESAKRTRPGSGYGHGVGVIPERFAWRRWVDQDWEEDEHEMRRKK